MGIGVRGPIIFKNKCSFFGLHGRWETLDSFKMMSSDMGVFSTVENLLLRTFTFASFFSQTPWHISAFAPLGHGHPVDVFCEVFDAVGGLATACL